MIEPRIILVGDRRMGRDWLRTHAIPAKRVDTSLSTFLSGALDPAHMRIVLLPGYEEEFLDNPELWAQVTLLKRQGTVVEYVDELPHGLQVGDEVEIYQAAIGPQAGHWLRGQIRRNGNGFLVTGDDESVELDPRDFTRIRSVKSPSRGTV